MKNYFLGLVIILALTLSPISAEPPISEDTESCLECHTTIHPGIVESWKKSRHAAITPEKAMSVKGLGLKVSSKSIPERLKNQVVGCAECHTLRSKFHKDTFEHNGYDVHIVVSPKDCQTCHSQEAQQFEKNLMSHAYDNLMKNSVYQMLMASINSSQVWDKDVISVKPSNDQTKADACLYCHGTKLEVKGTRTRETDLGEMDFPVIAGWPNQGTGRINLDGSLGACSACHTRHRFSIEMARKPYTCKECHVGPDVPAYKVYSASKHGNIYETHNKEWDFQTVPWTIGKDIKAPTCASCHMSLLVNTEGEVVVERSHEVKDRLPYRIFGLIYAHPHPRQADTTIIKNKDGLPLPTDFAGGFADGYLLDKKEMDKNRGAMQASCLACHDTSWVEGHWNRFLNTIKETNDSILTTTKIMADIWGRDYAAGVGRGSSPFDEFIEKTWCDGWLFYANSIRFSSAMAGGGDYGVFAQGRYYLSKNIREMIDWLELRNELKKP
jgi:hypothetical protein